MKTKLIATLLLAGSSLFAAPRVVFGVRIGVPIAPAPVLVAPPIVTYATPCPGPGYVWIGGQWVFGGPRYVAPRYFRGPAFAGARHFRR